ncbi:hypothetical protein PDJAM_G00175510 [Pangasius djambal]|uniref:Uncharacterized protein n=1 Tax=Pangasius djambal TaxID=1691987 RepID=A0ACC5ZMH3_9TELE|nr:hypothetical protein [Pangasius djambal]
MDSEDDSEEDDLVLNYPRNGLASHSHAATLRLGKEEAELHEEDEDEEDAWRRGGGKDRRGETGGAADEGVGLVSEGAGQKAKVRAAVRTAAFVVPLICAAMFVLLFAFLLPCQRRGSQRRKEWETEVGHVGGVRSPPMALWDVDGDGVEDLLIAAMRINNSSQQISFLGNSKEYSVVALHGVNGSVIWNRSLKEPLSSVQCSAPNTCLLITLTHLSSVNASTGKKLWEVPAGEVASQAVAVPDLQGDSVPDLLIATLSAEQESALSLVLHSGLTGSLIGQPVNFNLTAQGKQIGPMLHETAVGAYYILSVDHVEYFLPLVAGVCNNHNNLDAESSRNSSRSDWVLVCVNGRISVIRERDIHTTWTINTSSIHSHPAIGHFNDDGVPDLLIQISSNGVRKVHIIDGAQGQSLWEAEFVCPHLVLEGSTILTTSGQSVFLFWAGDPLPVSKNVTKVTASERMSYDDEQKDVSYVVVVSRPVSGPGPGAQLVKSVSVRASLSSATAVRLSDDTHTRTHTAFQINSFFRSLSFRRQFTLVLVEESHELDFKTKEVRNQRTRS